MPRLINFYFLTRKVEFLINNFHKPKRGPDVGKENQYDLSFEYA